MELRTIKTKNMSEIMQNAPETETMPDQPERDVEAACEFTEAEKHLTTYVCVVILEVFDISKAYKGQKKEVVARDTERLLGLIIEGLPKDLVPNISFVQMAKSVHKQLVRVFGRKLKDTILRQDPAEEKSIIGTFLTKLKKHGGKPPQPFRCTFFAAICWGIVLAVSVMMGVMVGITMLVL